MGLKEDVEDFFDKLSPLIKKRTIAIKKDVLKQVEEAENTVDVTQKAEKINKIKNQLDNIKGTDQSIGDFF